MKSLTFKKLSKVNAKRCKEVFHPINDRSPTDWACALAGETGEYCNFVKKMRRGDNPNIKKIAKELADIIIYADLNSTRLGIDLDEAVINKFNEISDKKNCNIKL